MNDDIKIPSTSKELFELLQQAAPQALTDEDYKAFRYVVYARKSTTGDERQEKSIPHQVDECMRIVVEPNQLTLIRKPIREKGSAKEPDIRDKFNQMIEDIENGKIDGVIAWHPDRLSRNMKEAGIIIDLLDKGILKDLRFATSTFENSPTGKMLLGISFVLSKQYSEHLSESVTRGNKKKTEEGIFFDEMKHGYVINKGKLYPDGANFIIVRELFDKRLEGWSQPDIAKWLNEERSEYRLRKKDKNPTPYKWDKDSVGKVLKDPVYAGVLKYGESFANLEEYYDFTPIVEVEEFFKVNKIKDFSSSKISSAVMSKKREVTKANLLRNVVFCGYCNKSFSSGLTPKVLKDKKVWYYLYRCETDGCEFKGKSVRAKHILDYAYDWFDTHVFTTKSNYEHYKEDARQDSMVKAKEVNSNIMSVTRLVGEKKDEYTRAKDLISERPELSRHYDLDEIQAEQAKLEERLKELQGDYVAIKRAPITYEQYLELFQDISVRLENSNDMQYLDEILRKFFSNFTVKSSGRGKQQRCEIAHKLKEPWDGFVKSGDFDCGRGDRT